MAIYEYAARCLRVVDGDTVDLEVDLGFGMRSIQRFRLMGIDTPELRGGTPESKEKAKEAKARVEQLLIHEVNPQWGDFPILVHTEKADSFGRYLANVLVFVDFSNENPHNPQHWTSVSGILLEEGLAVRYEK